MAAAHRRERGAGEALQRQGDSGCFLRASSKTSPAAAGFPFLQNVQISDGRGAVVPGVSDCLGEAVGGGGQENNCPARRAAYQRRKERGKKSCSASKALRRSVEGEGRPVPETRQGGLQTTASNWGGPSGQGPSTAYDARQAVFPDMSHRRTWLRKLFNARRSALLRAASTRTCSFFHANHAKSGAGQQQGKADDTASCPRSARDSSPRREERAKFARWSASSLKRKDASG